MVIKMDSIRFFINRGGLNNGNLHHHFYTKIPILMYENPSNSFAEMFLCLFFGSYSIFLQLCHKMQILGWLAQYASTSTIQKLIFILIWFEFIPNQLIEILRRLIYVFRYTNGCLGHISNSNMAGKRTINGRKSPRTMCRLYKQECLIRTSRYGTKRRIALLISRGLELECRSLQNISHGFCSVLFVKKSGFPRKTNIQSKARTNRLAYCCKFIVAFSWISSNKKDACFIRSYDFYLKWLHVFSVSVWKI